LIAGARRLGKELGRNVIPVTIIDLVDAVRGGSGRDDEQNFTPRHVAPMVHRLLISVPDVMLPNF
jgi:hypothetical protein